MWGVVGSFVDTPAHWPAVVAVPSVQHTAVVELVVVADRPAPVWSSVEPTVLLWLPTQRDL